MRNRNKWLFFLLPLCSSALLVLSFPRFNFAFLAWIALLPLLIYCNRDRTDGKRAFGAGFLAGLFFFLYLYAYLALSINFVLPLFYGYAVVIISSLYSAVFYGLFSLLVHFLYQRALPYLFALGVPAGWVVLEHLRSLGLLGHTGGYLGYSQTLYPFFLQVAGTYGYWGLSFLMVLFQVVLFLFLAPRSKANTRKVSGKRRPAVLFASIVLFLLLGVGLLAPDFFNEKKDRPLRIALIQGNIPQERVLDSSYAEQNFSRYLHLTEKAADLYDNIDLVVWPETVFSTSVARRFPQARSELFRLSQAADAPILFGAMHRKENVKAEYNSIMLQKPGIPLDEEERYDKIRLVPLAEYFPFPAFFDSFNMDLAPGRYTPGSGAHIFQVQDFQVGGIICFESYFSQPALDTVRQGAEHLFVLSNDAWFLDSIGLDQHAQAAAVRAAELGVGVTQVANTGYTVSYDYTGRPVLSLPPLQQGKALLETDFQRHQTLYVLWGDYFLYICLALLISSCFTRKHNSEIR